MVLYHDVRVSREDNRPMLFAALIGRNVFLFLFSSLVMSAAVASQSNRGVPCGANQSIVIAAAGDIIIQPELEARARMNGTPYRNLWRAIEPMIRGADLAYANIEGPVAVHEPALQNLTASTNRPSPQLLEFNYRASLIRDLKVAGFDVISTANNHALDRGVAGADLTINRLQQGGLAFTGTRQRASRAPWSTLTGARGFIVGWLACTYGTNGIPDLWQQVLHCFDDAPELLAEIARLHAEPSIDAVFLVPHWGIENSTVVERRQRELAQAAIEAGALAVVGTHPHILQRWERMYASDGRQGLVIYSTGNFISAQTAPAQRVGIIAVLQLAKVSGVSKARLAAARYVLTRIVEDSGSLTVEEADPAATVPVLPAEDRVRIGDVGRDACVAK